MVIDSFVIIIFALLMNPSLQMYPSPYFMTNENHYPYFMGANDIRHILITVSTRFYTTFDGSIIANASSSIQYDHTVIITATADVSVYAWRNKAYLWYRIYRAKWVTTLPDEWENDIDFISVVFVDIESVSIITRENSNTIIRGYWELGEDDSYTSYQQRFTTEDGLEMIKCFTRAYNTMLCAFTIHKEINLSYFVINTMEMKTSTRKKMTNFTQSSGAGFYIGTNIGSTKPLLLCSISVYNNIECNKLVITLSTITPDPGPFIWLNQCDGYLGNFDIAILGTSAHWYYGYIACCSGLNGDIKCQRTNSVFQLVESEIIISSPGLNRMPVWIQSRPTITTLAWESLEKGIFQYFFYIPQCKEFTIYTVPFHSKEIRFDIDGWDKVSDNILYVKFVNIPEEHQGALLKYKGENDSDYSRIENEVYYKINNCEIIFQSLTEETMELTTEFFLKTEEFIPSFEPCTVFLHVKPCYVGCKLCSDIEDLSTPGAPIHNCETCSKNDPDEMYYASPYMTKNCFNKNDKELNWYWDDINDRYEVCDISCIECNGKKDLDTGDTNCIQCNSNDQYYPISTNSANCLNALEEHPGLYLEASVFYHCYERCYTCSIGYDDITGDHNCYICGTGYTKIHNTKNCENNNLYESLGYYLNPVDNELYPCTNNCFLCLSEYTCLSCVNNYYIVKDVNTCEEMTYADNGYYLKNNIFYKCDSPCVTCFAGGDLINGIHNCYTCEVNHYSVYSTSNCGDISFIDNGYYLYNNTLYLCDTNCLTCSAGKDVNSNNCKTCDVSNNWYLVYKLNNCENLDYLDANGYYWDTSDNIMYPCYSSCATCFGNGSNISHNCNLCTNNTFKEFNTDNCFDITYEDNGYILIIDTFHPCHPTCSTCSDVYNVWTDNHNCLLCQSGLLSFGWNCLTECPSNTYRYQFTCVDQCPQDTTPNNYNFICEDKEITLNEALNSIYNNLVNSSEIGTIIIGENYTVQVYQIQNQTNTEAISNDLKWSIVNWNECYNILLKAYNIIDSEDIIMIKIDTNTTDSSVNTANFFLFDFNGVQLDLSLCKDINITVTHHVIHFDLIDIDKAKELSDMGVDVFDAEDSFFNEWCYPFTTIDSTDVTMTYRRSDYYQNASFCEEGCQYDSFIFENSTVICNCVFDNYNELGTNLIDSTNKGKFDDYQSTLSKLASDFTSSLVKSNWLVIKCYNWVFDLDNFLHNYGMIVLWCLLVIQWLLAVVFVFSKGGALKAYMLVFVPDSPPKKRKESRKESSNSRLTSMNWNNTEAKGDDDIRINKAQVDGYDGASNSCGNSEEIATSTVIHVPWDINQNNMNLQTNHYKRASCGNGSLVRKSIQNLIPTKTILTEKWNNESDKYSKNESNINIKETKRFSSRYSSQPRSSMILYSNSKNRRSTVSTIILINNQKTRRWSNNKSSIINNVNTGINIETRETITDLHQVKINAPRLKSISLTKYMTSPLSELIPYKNSFSITRIYSYYLSEKQIIINTFFNECFLEFRIIKIVFWFLSIGLDFSLNALFFDEFYITDFYKSKGIYDFITSLPKSIYSWIVGFVIGFVLTFLSNSKNSLNEIVEKSKGKKIRKEEYISSLEKVLKILKIKLLFFFVIMIILMLFFAYFVSAFCAVFRNNQVNWIIGATTSFMIALLLPFLFCFIMAISYFCSVKYQLKLLFKVTNWVGNII